MVMFIVILACGTLPGATPFPEDGPYVLNGDTELQRAAAGNSAAESADTSSSKERPRPSAEEEAD
jgi:hypothetical protein